MREKPHYAGHRQCLRARFLEAGGEVTPSATDVEMTREVVEAGRRCGIAVHDRVIVTRHSHPSFKMLGLI